MAFDPVGVAMGGTKSRKTQAPIRCAEDLRLSPAPDALDTKFLVRIDAVSAGGAADTLLGRRNRELGEPRVAFGPSGTRLGGKEANENRPRSAAPRP